MATILQPVGRGGANLPTDVQLVQMLLNRRIAELAPSRPLRVDGQLGPKTIAAIEAFQSRVVGMDPADGRIDLHGKTLRALAHSKLVASTASKVPLGSRQIEKPTPQWLNVAAGEASWLPIATAEDGNTELAGRPRTILASWRTSPRSGTSRPPRRRQEAAST